MKLMRTIATVAGLLLGSAGSSMAQDAPPSDDRYAFVAGRSEERTVTLEAPPAGARFAWSPPRGTWDTALLGVRVSAGRADPRVDVSAGDARVQQHLDASARGLRWINLTGLRGGLREGAVVEFRGEGVTIEPGPATVRTFANGLDLSRPILILAPHPDDAEIAAFGLYAGRNATIVTVTSGNAGDANYKDHFPDAAEQYLFKGYLRALDSVTVPWQGGIPPERAFNLGYFDARLRTMQEKPGETVAELYGPNQDVSVYRRANIGRLLPMGPRTNSWAHLVEDLVTVLNKVKPEIVVTPHPFLDYHADHRYVTVALAEALDRWKKPAKFLLYTNHAAANLYPYGPAGTNVSPPPTGATLPPWAAAHELPVQGVYSHPVSADLQRRQLYALETMHDLRLSPVEQAACSDPSMARRPDYPRQPAVDYFRRGPRPDEIFFVFDRDGLRDLLRTFVAGDRAAAPVP